MTPINGKMHYDGAWRVMVGLKGPRFLHFAYFADDGVVKISKVLAGQCRYLKPIADARDHSTPALTARRFVYGRSSKLSNKVRGFLDRVIHESEA